MEPIAIKAILQNIQGDISSINNHIVQLWYKVVEVDNKREDTGRDINRYRDAMVDMDKKLLSILTRLNEIILVLNKGQSPITPIEPKEKEL